MKGGKQEGEKKKLWQLESKQQDGRLKSYYINILNVYLVYKYTKCSELSIPFYRQRLLGLNIYIYAVYKRHSLNTKKQRLD